MFVEDRSIAVPPGCRIITDYVPIFDVELACRERMAVGDFDRAYQKRLQMGDHQSWPCPHGYWKGAVRLSKFIIVDGRHEWLASVAIGVEFILVAWIECP